MKTFADYANQVSYQNRSETVAVLKAFLTEQLTKLCPESAGLKSASTAAHYDPQALNLEGVARLLWGVVPVADEAPEFLHALRAAVVNGVNPQHPAFWGEVTDYNQRCVEMSAIALAMVDQEAQFFAPLTQAERANIVAWLQSVSSIQIPNNNWHFFRVLILLALRHVGEDFNAEVLLSDLQEIDSMYLGEGWYRDGRSGCTDYYNPFAFHYYGLVFARWVNSVVDRHTSELNEYAQLFIHRAALFAKSFSLWIGEDGAPIAYGRSMSYRFAAAGIWSELACYSSALAKFDLTVSDMKALWAKSLRWWSKQPIICDGLLSVGYRYPNLISSEFYNSPMSPLLALKGFTAVRLAESHPFWQAEESDISSQSDLLMLTKNKQIVARYQGTSLLLSGSPSAAELRNSHDKYLKFAYSSAHGFCVEALRYIDQGFIGDNVMACRHPQTREWHFRSQLIDSYLEQACLVTLWQPFAGCRVETRQWFEQGVEQREHQITSEHAFDFIMSGYAVDTWVKCIGECASLPSSRIVGSEWSSELTLLNGEGHYDVMACAPNTNLHFAQAAVPVVHGQIKPGQTLLRVAVHSQLN